MDFNSQETMGLHGSGVIFRDGVGESQFNQVLNFELSQVIEACKFLDEAWNPKFLVIVAQKNHHTKFFQPGSPDNVPPGTVVDNKICHPRNYDFYLCAHAGMIGTSRPTHYHVLLDEIGFPQMIYRSLCTHFLMFISGAPLLFLLCKPCMQLLQSAMCTWLLPRLDSS
ncbi:unnamed protein product [Trifolium pratense]|uniref:Uncharacterized protein n=1 Tax=Trifolium pratense TaxID=57577 RepID=A0ACB0IQ49_TRIPR|nr:unnamed protein product [Trifolium pratense]